ncbi:MAG TPA: c-type cytochrome biogenesis protein CcsB [Dehalococcoidia bacterium]|nr:c-type cytochrome biogenesis protein CcsB [Dehalococcoidia bacterium]
MADLSLAAFWLALAATAAAVLLYWGHVLGVRLVLRRLATSSGAGPAVASLEVGGGQAGLPESLGRLASLATWTAAAFLALSLFARWRAVGHAPWSSMWEFTLAFAAAMTLSYVAFERWYGRGARAGAARTLGAVVQPLVLALLAVSAAFFPSDVRPLVPALQNQDLLAVHVAMMILAYGALSVSFAAGAMYLVQGPQSRFARLPKARLLDEIGYRSVMVGFPVLALGIALGAYWANSAWGRYWGWDPKETSALVTWLIYGAYLHMHGLRGWSGTRAAVVLVIGFAAVLFTYFAVNLWVSGLHSYAGV